MKKLLVSMCLCSAVALGAMQAQAATVRVVDSSQMDLTAINAVTAKPFGGVPVGTVIAWPFVSNPEDAENWLECNGQSVTSGVYPELFAIVGNKVPDLRNQFMRGGTSAQVGQVAGDTTRSHAHAVTVGSQTVSGTAAGQTIGAAWANGQNYMAASSGGSAQASLPISLKIIDPNLDHHAGDDFDGVIDIQVGSFSSGYYNSFNTPSHVTNVSGNAYFQVPSVSQYVAQTSGSSVSGWTHGSTISGWTSGGTYTTEAIGSSETAPQHIRVRYLIRALP